MTPWQRRARLVIGVAAVAFVLFVAFAFKRRADGQAIAPLAPQSVEPGAVEITLGGHSRAYQRVRETVSIDYKEQKLYSNGSMKFAGLTVISDDSDGGRQFKATAREGATTKDFTVIEMTGDVQLESNDLGARAEHATFSKNDNAVRAPGPVEVREGKTTVTGVGMTFDREHDVMTIADRAVIHMAPDDGGGDSTDITCTTAVFDRRQHFRRFEKNVRMQRGKQVIEADTAMAYLDEDGARIESIELRGGAGVTRIVMDRPAVGALQSLTGRDVTLKYAAAGDAIEHATLTGQTTIVVAGEAGHPGRRISAASMEIGLAPDGTTPTALAGRDSVELLLPAEPATGSAPAMPQRSVAAPALDAKGEPGRGLTRALFSGGVRYREAGEKTTSATSATLDVGLKPGMSEIEDARFARTVRFEQGALAATAAAARYDPAKGTLALSGMEGPAVPRVVNQQIAVDAGAIDVTLDGPQVTAKGNVKSVLQPAKKDAASGADNGVRLPSMLKQDQPVNVTADNLDYDGTKSLATYTGDARLFQSDTSVKAKTIVLDDKLGDLTAGGDVASTTMLKQSESDRQNNQKQRSTATAKDMKYEDETRRLTYTGTAHLTGPEGDMSAARIELYLKPSGDELDRAEAYEQMTLREQNRKTTGSRLTYTADDERYVITGKPVTIIDGCQRETTGTTLIFVRSTDNILIDGTGYRTQTKGGRANCTTQ
jgi:lipopolysaccharide transport protein LptA